MFKLKYLWVFSVFILTNCSNHKLGQVKEDPLEPLNRVTFQVNQVIDPLYINPLVQIYGKYFPIHFRTILGNFFSNIGEVPVIVNSLLQANPEHALISSSRFVLNSTIGFLGLFDVASKVAQIPKIKTDFGCTLYQWGYKNSMYLFLPILGPTTVRDGIGLVGNSLVSIPYYFRPKVRNYYQAAYVIHVKSGMSELKLLNAAVGLDDYIFMRNTYLQNRKYKLGESLGEEIDVE